MARKLRDAFLELPQPRHARCVAVYVSRSTEPGTYLLREALASGGVDVLHPVIGRATGLRWLASGEIPPPRDARAHHERRLPDRHGTARGCSFSSPPFSSRPLSSRPRWPSTPRGGGSDEATAITTRSFAWQIRPPLVLAAAHDTELFDSAVEPVPQEPHDVRVDAVLTPSRIHYLTDRCSR